MLAGHTHAVLEISGVQVRNVSMWTAVQTQTAGEPSQLLGRAAVDCSHGTGWGGPSPALCSEPRIRRTHSFTVYWLSIDKAERCLRTADAGAQGRGLQDCRDVCRRQGQTHGHHGTVCLPVVFQVPWVRYPKTRRRFVFPGSLSHGHPNTAVLFS